MAWNYQDRNQNGMGRFVTQKRQLIESTNKDGLIQYSTNPFKDQFQANNPQQNPVNNGGYNSQNNDDNLDDEDGEDDDEDEDEEGLIEYFSESVNDFFDEVISGKRNLSGDDIEWEITKNMSPQLLALFGVKSALTSPISKNGILAWQPPSKSGLENSAPIIPTAYNIAPNGISSMPNLFQNSIRPSPPSSNMYRSETASGFRRNYDFQSDKGVAVRSPQGQVMNNSYNSREEDEEEEEDEDDEDDDDEDFDDDDDDDESDGGIDAEEDEDAYANRILAMMSNNLKAATGVRATDAPLVTDWKPPARAGLDNSERIIK